MKKLFLILFILAVTARATAGGHASGRLRISLAGEWRSSLGTCSLPGTTDENRLGGGCTDSTVTYQLTRLYPFSGEVIYTRSLAVPGSFAGKRLLLFMERTKPSTLWIDGDSIGSFGHLYAPHVYELPPLVPGVHRFDIRIDNSPSSVPAEVQGSHAWSDATQTNWNGILGDFYLEALPAAYIRSLQVYPDVKRHRVRVVADLVADRAAKAALHAGGCAWNTPEERRIPPHELSVRLREGCNRVEFTMDMGEDPLLWSEFHPALYKLTVGLRTRHAEDRRSADFGMREFGTSGTQFVLNGNRTFLRGKHDACVFPLTGYAPMDVDAWREVFRTAKRYGINHYRCHSYTPPRAALVAADIEGIYFQLELPLWGTIDPEKEALNAFLRREGDMILDYLGNHPSFVMLGLGNELGGDVSLMQAWLDDFRRQDTRHLYCFGANNFLGWKGPLQGEDFFVTCRVGGGEGYTTHVRTSFAYVDAEKGGILNNTRPSTDRDYSAAVALCPRPVIGHETCQFQLYPDYARIAKYTGVLYPFNLEVFRRRLAEKGLARQAGDFHRATGRFAAECYKADIEYALRTPGFGGFQMLDLQDYPGQGSALVGILDAFMDDKGIVSPDVFRGFCAPVVPLALLRDHCLYNDQMPDIGVAVANYAEGRWNAPVRWSLSSDDGTWERSGELETSVDQGAVGRAGNIVVPLSGIRKACRLTLTLVTADCRNRYRLWVYPREQESAENVFIATEIDDGMRERLSEGSRVLFVPRHDRVLGQTVGGMFTPDYWNYSMFKTISERAGKEVSPGTLSVLTDPSHPLMREFPSDEHSDWQWWSITRNSRPMILDGLSGDYLPLVQVVDNIERNHKLGLVFEFAVGKGRLLVCMCDLQAVADTPEGNQWRNALLRYIKSDDFRPMQRLSWEELQMLFRTGAAKERITGVENASDYTQAE